MSFDRTSFVKAASLLEAVVSEKVDAATALSQWPDGKDKLILDARHRLDHYASDADIHKTNAAYKEKQRENLIEILDRIRKALSS